MKDASPDYDDLAPKNTRQDNGHFGKAFEAAEKSEDNLNEEHKS